MGFFVKFWGTRGSIPTPGFRTQKYGGNTACVEIRIDDVIFICDGGSGLRELGLDLMTRGAGPITGHMFYSHSHWDHIQGFPFFIPFYEPDNTFIIYGTSSGDQRMYELLSGQMQSDYFPVDFSEQTHQGQSFAYAFSKNGRKVVYATDNELDLTLLNPEESLSNPQALRRAPKPFLDFIKGADLLIADGQYTDEEYPKKIGWGHSRATTTVDLAHQAQAKQLAVFHHDPLQSDADVDKKLDPCLERAERLDPELIVFGAREGVELRIDS
jgi:phosphoribosyl 1,2-cyclic phosphodiesterase